MMGLSFQGLRMCQEQVALPQVHYCLEKLNSGSLYQMILNPPISLSPTTTSSHSTGTIFHTLSHDS